MFNPFKKQIIGLDISDTSIEAVQLLTKNKIEAYNRVKLEPGVVEDGKIKNQDKLVEALKKLFAFPQGKKFSTNNVVSSLPESKLFIYIFRIDKKFQGKELEAEIERRALETIPASIDELYWDFQKVVEDNNNQDIMFIGAPVDIIENHMETLIKAGLKPIFLDFESASMARSLIKDKKKGATMLVDIGARTTIISIYDMGAVRSTVNTNIAGNKFNNELKKQLNISEKEAEKKKRQVGFNENKEEGKVMLVLQSVMQPIIEEIKKSVEYYQEQTGRRVLNIILAGGSSQIPEISDHLKQNLGIEVKVGELLTESAGQVKGVSILLATALGLAMRTYEKDSQINLLPTEPRTEEVDIEKQILREEAKKLKKSNKHLIFPLILLAVPLVIIAATFLYYYYRPPTASTDIKLIESEVLATTSTQPVITEDTSTSIDEIIEPEISITMVTIIETGIGYLNVREGPGTIFTKITTVNVGENFELLEEQEEWYKIKISDDMDGWVFAEYVKK